MPGRHGTSLVPFADRLAEAIGRNPLGPRITRDFARLISLTKAVTVLRHRRRALDGQGRLVAELADYGFVRALVADIYAGSQSGASARIRATVEAVAGIVAETGGATSVTAVGERLGINKMAASRRVITAVKGGYLVNGEDRRGHPASLTPGEALPAADGLPTMEDLGRNGVTTLTGGDSGRSVGSEPLEADPKLPGNDGWPGEPPFSWETFGVPSSSEPAA